MPEEQYKRNIAYKQRIGEILLGKPIFDGEKFSCVELGDRRLVRINIIGNIIDKYESTGDTKYIFYTIDDGSGQLRVRIFGEDLNKFPSFDQGQTVLVVGLLRSYNNEVYVTPDIIKEQDPRYLLIRKIETEKERATRVPVRETEEGTTAKGALRDQILEKIKAAEDDGGKEIDAIIMELQDTPTELISGEITKLLEEGIVFEPRPGKIRWLG